MLQHIETDVGHAGCRVRRSQECIQSVDQDIREESFIMLHVEVAGFYEVFSRQCHSIFTRQKE